ncbi:MAG: MerR family transcriptional regulator, partial [Dietzia sp.]|nr:MerR family transcriptional regulator [Dietzia sp.]
MAEYRLPDLARVSGVSARNIRAYRERGLLDPPRRVGRSALYDDYHLSQLNTISELLAKGFTSTHIAEFFTSMRQGSDLADILGLQRAMLGPRSHSTDDQGNPIALHPGSEEARKLVDYGMAEIVAGSLVMIDGTAGDAVTGSPVRMKYIRALLNFIEAADDALDDLAKAFVTSLTESH